MEDICLAGGGIGGLTAALALGQQGVHTTLLEQADLFLEVGAGIGLGPNALRRLQSFGLGPSLRQRGFIPDKLEVRRASDAVHLGSLPMAEKFERRYGAPYMTIHRADLHKALLDAVQAQGTADLQLATRVTTVHTDATGVQLTLQNKGLPTRDVSTTALIATDGVDSAVRRQLWGDVGVQASGHWAYRTLMPRHLLPAVWRTDSMGLWLGERLHVVHYPVSGGEWLNLVVLLESDERADAPGWDHHRTPEQIQQDLRRALHGCHSRLQDLVRTAEHWRAWALFDRQPLRSAQDMVQGRVALLGDAAHPMLPYLAQGAGMAIEDAQALAHGWQAVSKSPEQRLAAYARARWQRVRRVQQRARQNARLFHASGHVAQFRDWGLQWGGAWVMDMPWLYGH